MKQLIIHLPDELYAILVKTAKEENKTRISIVREAIYEYLTKLKEKRRVQIHRARTTNIW